MKKIMKIAVMIGLLVIGGAGVYAMTRYYLAKSVKSEFTKKHIFTFDLSTGLTPEEIGPGDSFHVNPTVYNDATEEMYVFIQVVMPTTADGALYSFDVDGEWTLVENANGTVVYAYGNTEMAVLCPGESTSALTSQMTMQQISNAEYAWIDDVNITVTGYAIGIEDVSTNPIDAWNECKEIGNMEW